MFRKLTGKLNSLVAKKGEKKDEADEVYNSYQTTLNTLIATSSLLMGFIMTGAIIGISYSPDTQYSQPEVATFVRKSYEAFVLSMFTLVGALFCSVIASSNHAMIGTENAVATLRALSWLVALSEISCWRCMYRILMSLSAFLMMNFVTPASELCPGRTFDIKNNLTTHSKCALLGVDLYEAATTEKMCGPPRCGPPLADFPGKCVDHRPFNILDSKSVLCSQVDEYANQTSVQIRNKTQGYWFGWLNPGGSFSDEIRGKIRFTNIAKVNAKLLGEFMCDKQASFNRMQTLCGADHASANCMTATMVYNQAGQCANAKVDDVLSCARTCAWMDKWRLFRVLNGYYGCSTYDGDSQAPMTEVYTPIVRAQNIGCWIIDIAMYLRIFNYLIHAVYICHRLCRSKRSGSDSDSEDEMYDQLSRENSPRSS